MRGKTLMRINGWESKEQEEENAESVEEGMAEYEEQSGPVGVPTHVSVLHDYSFQASRFMSNQQLRMEEQDDDGENDDWMDESFGGQGEKTSTVQRKQSEREQELLDEEQEESTRQWQDQMRIEEMENEDIQPTYERATPNCLHNQRYDPNPGQEQLGGQEVRNEERQIVLEKQGGRKRKGRSKDAQETMEEEEKMRYFQKKIRQEEVGYEERKQTRERIVEEKGKISNAEVRYVEEQETNMSERDADDETLEQQCGHECYDLESYEMVDRTGYNWMRKDTTQKMCDRCDQKKKLTRKNPMYYCRTCHDHRICNGCWTTRFLWENDSQKGRPNRQCKGIAILTKEVELMTEEIGNGNDISSDDSITVLSERPRQELGKGENMNEVSERIQTGMHLVCQSSKLTKCNSLVTLFYRNLVRL
jgi:hypothetical protein